MFAVITKWYTANLNNYYATLVFNPEIQNHHWLLIFKTCFQKDTYFGKYVNKTFKNDYTFTIFGNLAANNFQIE